jgi:hypothetical protein
MRQLFSCLIVVVVLHSLARSEEPAKACPKAGACAKSEACAKATACAKSGECAKAGACAKACEAQAACGKACDAATTCKSGKSCCQQGDQVAVCGQKSPCCQSECDIACQPQDKLTHLEKAVKHLEAAGLADEAQRVAEHAHQLRRELLAKKLAELSRLQVEIQSLTSETHKPQQVLIKLQVVEVSLTKLRALGLALPDGLSGVVARCGTDVCPAKNKIAFTVCRQDGIVGFVESLRRENIAKVLAEPNLVTVSGRPVSYFCGGEVAAPGKPGATHEVGTRVDAVVTMIHDDKVRLEIRPRVSTLDAKPAPAGKDAPTSGLHVHEIDTACEVEFGQTAVIGGMVQDRIHADASHNAVQTLFLVTLERVDALPPTAEAPSNTQAK